MSEWREIILGKIGEFSGGVTSIKKEDYGYGYPFLTYMNVFKNWRVDISSLALMNVNERDLQKKDCKYGDIFFTASSETEGEVAMSSVLLDSVENLVFNGFCKRYRLHDFKTLSPHFAQYLFRARQFRARISQLVTGDVRFNISQRSLQSISLLIPPIKEQQAIVDVLSSLDNKIEHNRRAIEKLEAMGKALFQSWFVDFDPVRAKAAGHPTELPDAISTLFPNELVSSQLGDIPKGWDVDKIGNCFDCLDKKRIPIASNERAKRSGNIPYYGANGIIDWIDDYIFDGTYLLIGEDGSVVKDDGTAFSHYVSGKIWVNNHAHVLVGNKSISTEFLYLFFQFVKIKPYVTGAVQPKISQTNLRRIPLVVPSQEILSYFNGVISLLMNKQLSLGKEISTLTCLRDTLLPKLMSGELRVTNSK